jgi:hypothetical protein
MLRFFLANGRSIKHLQSFDGRRVIKVNTLLRVVYTLAISLIWVQSASAQTVLNFAKTTVNDQVNAGFAVTNPTSNYADLQFTLFGADGNPVSSGLLNPVRYRLAPKGHISMLASDVFASSKIDGWVQVTSPTTGLTGYYFAGDFVTTLEGAEPSKPLAVQVIPVVREDDANKTELVIVNPGSASSTVTVTLFNPRGEQTGVPVSQTVGAHAMLRLATGAFTTAGGTFSARIASNIPVAATAIINRSGSLLFAPGQPIDQSSSIWVAPHFTTVGFDPVLVLTNPNASSITVTVTPFTDSGTADAPPRNFSIPPNGSVSADAMTILQRPFTPQVSDWLRVESPTTPLNGLLILDAGRTMTSMPFQSAPMDRLIYPQMSEASDLFTGVVFVNTWASSAKLDISLVRGDGITFAQRSLNVPANSKYSGFLRDLVPEAAVNGSGYVAVRSSLPIYATGLLGATNRAFATNIQPVRPLDGFTPNPPVAVPKLFIIDPGTDVHASTTITVSVANTGGDATFWIGNQNLSARQLGLASLYVVDIPEIETGSVKLRVRSNGTDSDPVTLHVLPAVNQPMQNISGRALYRKIDVTDAGLDLTHPVMVPVRHARVEVFSRTTLSTVAVSETDEFGRFDVPVPADPTLTVRVLSRLRFSNLRVADNTNLSALYAMSADIDGRQSNSSLMVIDTSRVSGAFNILEMVQRANETVRMADPTIDSPQVTIFWSTKNTRKTGNVALGLIGTSFFNVANNTAYILGDRDVDSDEFDDSVIVHEYGHMLAAKFSRDDSPGGATHLGDILDPRVAWSEGWANFFSSAVRNDPIWRDDSGPNGATVYRFDLRDKIPAGDNPGYWSEASVGSLLWELYAGSDLTGNTAYPFPLIWSAFTDLRNDRFVYLPYFLEHFTDRNPTSVDAVQAVTQLRSIDFRANVRPSVTMPFPRPMNGNIAIGFVDSATSHRANLMLSSHFWSFTSPGGAASIRMDITGLGPAGNPNTNDLDIFLMDADGRLLDKSDRGLNGQSELISIRLPGGIYVVEVRSFYIKAETGNYVYNSGDYRLNVSFQ